jgi:formylglycine-generating enzyme required for sulfatase activity
VRATGRDDPDSCAAMTDGGEWRSTTGLSWRNPGFSQEDDHPVVCVSWEDAQAYAAWLASRTGERYRLITESEFEYAARGGATTPFPWGADAAEACAHANGFDLTAQRAHPDWNALACDDGFANTAPVAAFPPNRFDLLGMTGNVFQWTEDCFHESYVGAPVDGSAWTNADCNVRVIRGGSWLNSARGLRAAMRDLDRQTDRYTNVGVRMARAKR